MGYTVRIVETVTRIRGLYVEDAGSPAAAVELARMGFGEVVEDGHEERAPGAVLSVEDDGGEIIPEDGWKGGVGE